MAFRIVRILAGIVVAIKQVPRASQSSQRTPLIRVGHTDNGRPYHSDNHARRLTGLLSDRMYRTIGRPDETDSYAVRFILALHSLALISTIE